MTNYPTRSGVSRTAEKFVVRLPDNMRAAILARAGEQHTSMNTIIVNAVEAYLGGEDLRHSLNIEIEAVKLLRGITNGAQYEHEQRAAKITAENCDRFRKQLKTLFDTLQVEEYAEALGAIGILTGQAMKLRSLEK